MTRSLAVGALGLVLTACALYAADEKSAPDEQAAAAKQKAAGGAAQDPSNVTDWAMNATIIEACSCPMFCQCYFGTQPAAHAEGGHDAHAGHQHGEGGEHYCKFNNAYP